MEQQSLRADRKVRGEPFRTDTFLAAWMGVIKSKLPCMHALFANCTMFVSEDSPVPHPIDVRRVTLELLNARNAPTSRR